MTTPPGSVHLNLLPAAQAARIWAVIEQLDPLKRDLLLRIGEPQWVGSALPWQPSHLSEEFLAYDLCLLGVAERLFTMPSPAFRLTAFGDQVARVLYQWEHFTPQGGPS
jgi:hypothetical protein